jgi:hypothetical protein
MATRSAPAPSTWPLNHLVGLALLACLTVAAPAAGPPPVPLLVPLTGAAELPPAPWHVAGLPKQTKPLTRFRLETLDGARVLRIEAEQSYGNLVHPLPADTSAHALRWRWRIAEPNALIDLRHKEGDDSMVKVCAFFDEPLSAVPFVERQVLRLARSLSPEPLPAATVCYLWDNQLPPGTMLHNAFTHRVRFVVLRGPESAPHQWLAEQRDLHADYKRLFSDESDSVPPLIGIGVGADADNTHARSVAHLADLVLE